MSRGERVAPIAAAMSAVATLLCCLPLSFAGALSLAGLSGAALEYRRWLMAASVGFLAVGFVQVYRQPAQCKRRSRLSIGVLWVTAMVTAVVFLLPQLVATLIADWLG